MNYPGLTYLGSERFSALYGLNETIVDQKAIGVQHLFIDDYQQDLIHTACSVITYNQSAYFGDRVKPLVGHPDRIPPVSTQVHHHCILEDVFKYEVFEKTDQVGANKNHILFQTKIKNNSKSVQTFGLAALVISQSNLEQSVTPTKNRVVFQFGHKTFAVISDQMDRISASLDAPSGFMYHGIEDILLKKNELKDTIHASTPIAVSLNREVTLLPNEQVIFRWAIVVGNFEDELNTNILDVHFDSALDDIKNFWDTWLKTSALKSKFPDASKTILVALKAANLNGLLPADLTGHYFANGKVSFYVRDALMGSRAFLYAGFYHEFEQVIQFLMQCPLKESGEFYQRYNSFQHPDEGANNSVFSQIDSIGYLARVLSDYYDLTGRVLVEFETMAKIVNVLKSISTKQGLFGPEGGVNEGVFGPAYIGSTNMFIVGGLLGAAQLASKLNHPIEAKVWKEMAAHLTVGIEKTFLNEGYYAYGYVNYHSEIIRKYDTPQLLATSLGYPITEQFIQNFRTLSHKAVFFGNGFGYSEQEYHHGPWLFNTCAAAETAMLIDDQQKYIDIMEWILSHRNGYGLLPEAIDATDEKRTFINPLMWANAEFVCAAFIDEIKALRKQI